MRLLPLLLLLPLLTGYRTYLPASAEPPDSFAWTANYDQSHIYSALANFNHMPLDQLPQDLQASLVLTEETGFDGFYPTHWGHWRTYAAPGLKIHTSAPSKAYLDHLEEIYREGTAVYLGTELCESEAQLRAGIAGEENREWLTWVEITSPDYPTQKGLRVGMTVEEAGELGYPLSRITGFGGGLGNMLDVTVEEGKVTKLRCTWGIGRYIGKFHEP